MSIIPTILCGGAGTRLWPLSRRELPKPFHKVGEFSLFQDTVRRTQSETEVRQPLIVGNEAHRFWFVDQLGEIGLKPYQVILEPAGRNTAPAIALAALALQREGRGQEAMLVLPSDHVMNDEARFAAAVAEGEKRAMEGYLVTFGIQPTYAETGYGYIKAGAAVTADSAAHKVARFEEKPDTARAEGFVQDGGYYWNSGIFMFTPDTFLSELEAHAPAILQACTQAMDAVVPDGVFLRPDGAAFDACPDNSIDFAIIEHTTKAVVVPYAGDWSDVGNWNALGDELLTKDDNGNHLKGDVVMHDTANTLVYAESALVATVGVKDQIVVQTPDAVLVADKAHAQDVKKIVDQLKNTSRSEHIEHRQVHRPWGFYESLVNMPGFQVKRLGVKPGAKLSLQLHHHRSEHWVVVKGIATVTNGEEVFDLEVNQSTYIPVETKHRLENRTEEPLEIIEVQVGGYLGEDDIVRFDDVYGRSENAA